jgi:tRNA A37 N6-isopentenylltransferase MiaA
LREEIEQMRRATLVNDSKIPMVGLNQAIGGWVSAVFICSASLKPSVGYKEFDAYFEDPTRPQLEFDRGVERMKVATRQYATRQVKWLKTRLLPTILASKNVQIVLLEIKGKW